MNAITYKSRLSSVHSRPRATSTIRSSPTPPVQCRSVNEMMSLAASTASYVSTPADQLKAASVVAVGAGSFATFFLAIPQFGSAFRGGEDSWKDIYPVLVDSKVSSIKPSDAAEKVKKGKAVLLDVRLKDKHLLSHPARARSVPLYRSIVGWDVPSVLRRLGFLFFGVANSERDPNFLSNLSLAVPSKNKEVVLICEMGGSLKPKPGAETGFQSRSLKASYYLVKEGYSKVSVVEGGVQQWGREGLDMVEGEETFEEEEGEEKETSGNALASAFAGLFGRK